MIFNIAIFCQENFYTNEYKINNYGIDNIYKDLTVEKKDENIYIKKTIMRNKIPNGEKIYQRISFHPLTKDDEKFFLSIHSRENGLMTFHNYNPIHDKAGDQQYNKAFFQDILQKQRPYNIFVIYLDDIKIGIFNLYTMDDKKSISYSITIVRTIDKRKIQGKGYGTIALEKIIDYIIYLNAKGEINADYIEALVSTKNYASMKINERNGFTIAFTGNYRKAGEANIYKIFLK